MKKIVVLCSLAVLAGCAAPGGGELGPTVMETSANMRAERWVPRTFVQVQRAVFQHQAACHSDIKFAVDELHPSYARVSMPLGSTSGQNNPALKGSMVLGLQLLEGKPARARLYSYYAPTKAQIQEMFDAILHPERCPGDPPPAEPGKEGQEE